VKKQLIISIGTGRSGSLSLSKFLSSQKKIQVLHEGRLDSHKIRKLIKWENDEKKLFNWLKFLINYDNQISYIGDTGMYYLPYIELIIEKYPDVKVIGMIRKKEEVVNSFLRKTEGRNHWCLHDGKKWDADNKWDPCFPKYKINNKKEAIEKYYDDYNAKVKLLTKKYADNVKLWSINDFNVKYGKNEILDFINYKYERNISKDFKHNTNLKQRKK